MMEQFSFHYHILEYMLINIEKFVKGMDMCDIIIYDEKSKKPVMKTKKNPDSEDDSIDEVPLDSIEKDAKALMSAKPDYYWHYRKEFAWRFSKFKELRIGLFAESEILQINIGNKSKSGLNDVIVFYFPDNLKNFRLIATDGNLQFTLAERDLIGNLIKSAIHFIATTGSFDQSNWEILQKHHHELEIKIMQLHADKDKLQSAFAKSIVKYCQLQLKKIADEKNTELTFSEELIEEFKKLQEVPIFLDKDIINALKIKKLKEKLDSQKPVVIEVTDLKISFEPEEPLKLEDKTIELQLRVPYSFLERIESAMLLLDHQRKPFTGDNVGAYMVPDVTKSAITQYRNAHQDSLRQLLNRYPDKWTLTRNYFKPIKYLLENQDLGQEAKRKKAI